MALRMIRVDQKSTGHGIQIRWNAVFSGTFATLGFGLLFLLLGSAVGLSIHNTISPGVSGALRFWSWIYNAVMIVVSYYLGTMAGTRSNEITSIAGGAIHGVSAWGLASFLALALAVFVSPTARLIMQGEGPDSGNWLALAIVGCGFFGAVLGGMTGKQAAHYSRVEEETRPEEARKIA